MDMMLSPSFLNNNAQAIRQRMDNHTDEDIQQAIMRMTEDHWEHCTRHVENLVRPQQFDQEGVKRFEVNGLGNWLSIATDYTDVVHAELLCGFSTQVIIDAFRGQTMLFVENVPVESIRGRVVRFDHCGSIDLKMAYTFGTPNNTNNLGWDEVDGKLSLHLDERIVGLGMSYQYQDFIPVWHRPFIKARQASKLMMGVITQSWPVEFRAYVQNNKVIGVSNYYVQMGLSDEFLPYAEKVWEISETIVAGMIKDQLLPSHPRYEEHPDIDENKITATLDFILDEDDELLFLEGGPGHLFNPHWGGNPCCFEPGKIDGIALKSRQ